MRPTLRFLLALAGLLLHLHAFANCIDDEALRHGIDPTLLRSMAWQESDNNPAAIGPELKDGNVAIGLLQINTIHLKRLEKVGITKEKLFDACTSAKLGAQILLDCIKKFGRTWKAVGCYNTGPASEDFDAQSRFVASVAHFYDQVKKNPDARPRRRKSASKREPKPTKELSPATVAVARAGSAAQIRSKVWESDE